MRLAELGVVFFLSVSAITCFAAPVAAAGELTGAVRARDVPLVLSLLKSGADPNERSRFGRPLGIAAGLGPPEIVDALLDAGADLEWPGPGGARALHAAALAGRAAIAGTLIRRGAKIDAVDNMGRTPLLTFVTGSGEDIDTLATLLAAGGNPNEEEPSSRLAALHFAAIRGQVEAAELLVKAGANVNARDRLHGETPLHHASVHGQWAIADFLIAHGAEVNAENAAGRTALSYAHCSGVNSLLRDILLKAGANMGQTAPVQLACPCYIARVTSAP